MSNAPNYGVSAEQNGANAFRASDFGARALQSLQIVKDNGTTGFGQILSGTPMGRITATGKYRPCGKATASVTAAGGNIASADDLTNFYVGDAVDIISTLGVAGALAMVASAGGDVIDIAGKNKDGKAHAFVLSAPVLAGAALAKTEAFSAGGVLTTTVSLATSQHTLSPVVDGSGKTIVITSKDGKAHSVQLVDPGAEAPMSQTVDIHPTTGVATIKIYLKNSVAPAITATVNEVVTELNRSGAGQFVSAALGTAVGSETAIAVGAAPLAGGGAITSTLAQVITLLNQGDSGEVITAAIGDGDSDAATAIAVSSVPLAGGAAAGGTLASNRTLSAVVKTTTPNTATFSGGTVDLVEGDVIQLRNGAETAVYLLDGTVSTFDDEGTRIAQAATYRDVQGLGAWCGLFKASAIPGWDAAMLADLGGTLLAANSLLRL